jgi:formylmethanofuran dehydrogenase subunit E
MDPVANPRHAIEEMIRQEDSRGLLLKAGELHGHFCPYVSLGVRASVVGLRELGVVQNSGMEEHLAIVETNNCFSDGIQMVSGCTFANNALIYRDLGKTAVTFARRNGEGVRVAVSPAFVASFDDRFAEGRALFQKIVVRREEPTPEERATLGRLWREASFSLVDVPAEELFTVERVTADVPAYAPIHASAICSVCGEPIMETRARLHEGEPICLTCSGAEHYQLDGAGIAVHKEGSR